MVARTTLYTNLPAQAKILAKIAEITETENMMPDSPTEADPFGLPPLLPDEPPFVPPSPPAAGDEVLAGDALLAEAGLLVLAPAGGAGVMPGGLT